MREGMVLYDEGGQEIWACPNIDCPRGTRGRRADRRGLTPSSIYTRAGRLDLDHRPGPAALDPPEPPRDPRRGPPSDDARRLGHRPSLRRVLHRSLARFLLRPVRPGGPHLVAETVARAGRPDIAAARLRIRHGRRRGHFGSRGGDGHPAGTPVVAGGADTQIGLLAAASRAGPLATVVGGPSGSTRRSRTIR